IFFCLVITLAFSLLYRVFLRRSKLSFRTFAPEIFCLIGWGLYVTLFSSAFDAMKTRMDNSEDEQKSRVIGTIMCVVTALETSHVTGNGIGAGSSGGRTLLGAVHRRSRSS